MISEMLLFKRHWETLMRTFGTGVLELDPGGRILMANVSATELLGDKETRLIGKALAAFCHPRDRERLQDILDKLAKARLPEVSHAEIHLANCDVTLRLASTVDEGECVGILCTLER